MRKCLLCADSCPRRCGDVEKLVCGCTGYLETGVLVSRIQGEIENCRVVRGFSPNSDWYALENVE